MMNGDKNICLAYSILTESKVAKDSLQKSIEEMCIEKISNKAWIQKFNGNIYGWQLQGNDKFFCFSTTQIK